MGQEAFDGKSQGKGGLDLLYIDPFNPVGLQCSNGRSLSGGVHIWERGQWNC